MSWGLMGIADRSRLGPWPRRRRPSRRMPCAAARPLRRVGQQGGSAPPEGRDLVDARRSERWLVRPEDSRCRDLFPRHVTDSSVRALRARNVGEQRLSNHNHGMDRDLTTEASSTSGCALSASHRYASGAGVHTRAGSGNPNRVMRYGVSRSTPYMGRSPSSTPMGE